MARIIGIDFGTTNSLAAFVNSKGEVEIVEDHNGDVLTPSIVAKFNNKLIIGREAKGNIKAFVNGDGVKEIKREIGKNRKVYFAGEYMEPCEIAALILAKVKGNAEIQFGEDVEFAVITVPAEFSDAQRKEIHKAAEMAGLKVKKIINEPTAALLAYSRDNFGSKKVVCYDFGGGTFDVSVANITDLGVEVIAVGGNRELGGKDIDNILFSYLVKDLTNTKGVILDKEGEYKLFLEVEKAKIKLSNSASTAISIPSLSTTRGKVPYFKQISSSTFETLIMPIIEKTVSIVKDTLDDKNISISQIDEVVLVGGSSRIPLVKRKLERVFGSKVKESKNIDKCVAMGAAIEAANQMGSIMKKRSTIKRDVCPFNLGLKVARDGSTDVFDPIVFKNSPYGEEFSEKYNTAVNNQKTMVLEIYQGESQWASQNEHITDFEITGIPQRPAGSEWVKITFKYDENGIINIKARVLSTGAETVHSYKYGYKLRETVDTSVVEENMIDSEKKIFASQVKEQLKREGLTSIAGEIDDCLKYEQDDMLTDILEEYYD